MAKINNQEKQNDEVEALRSIYDAQFLQDFTNQNIFTIDIGKTIDSKGFKLAIQIELNSDYPSDSPPTYQIIGNCICDSELMRLHTDLQDLYCKNIGESIIFIWVEKIRETLLNKVDHQNNITENTASIHLNNTDTNKESEEDTNNNLVNDDEYGFDPKLHVFQKDKHNEGLNNDSNNSDIVLPPIYDGEVLIDRKSIFQGHLAPISHQKQVKMVLDKLKENKRINAATHNIYAYRLDGNASGCEDDGEVHAGSRMLHLLTIVGAMNVIVVVTRWYGGIHLGPDRYKHINTCTRNLLEQYGYIHDKTKKGPKSTNEVINKLNKKKKR